MRNLEAPWVGNPPDAEIDECERCDGSGRVVASVVFDGEVIDDLEIDCPVCGGHGLAQPKG